MVVFVAPCLEKYANVNKEMHIKETCYQSLTAGCGAQGKRGRMRSEGGRGRGRRRRGGGGGCTIQTLFAEIMKRSKTHKGSRCHFHNENCAQLWRLSTANECLGLRMLTTGHTLGAQLRPRVGRTDRSPCLCHNKDKNCGQTLRPKSRSVSALWIWGTVTWSSTSSSLRL